MAMDQEEDEEKKEVVEPPASDSISRLNTAIKLHNSS